MSRASASLLLIAVLALGCAAGAPDESELERQAGLRRDRARRELALRGVELDETVLFDRIDAGDEDTANAISFGGADKGCSTAN